ncbi:hypothetical protein EVAR_93806_1 [Eumeta japonica]|uniref:Uncharacterized protein n=1 Tax=Eumeta variegata TaxID=151549 RepID=A0A4C1VBW0_EUMVA|nr:hypothetical protein EVAR_93806_1 [Eumeta japonica]
MIRANSPNARCGRVMYAFGRADVFVLKGGRSGRAELVRPAHVCEGPRAAFRQGQAGETGHFEILYERLRIGFVCEVHALVTSSYHHMSPTNRFI